MTILQYQTDLPFNPIDLEKNVHNPNQSIILQLADKDKGILNPIRIQPILAGKSEKPDVNIQLDFEGVNISSEEYFDAKTKATFFLTISQENEMDEKDKLFYCIIGGLNLYDEITKKKAGAVEFRKSISGVLGNKLISLPNAIGGISLQVVQHQEPKWWQRVFSLANSESRKELFSLIGFSQIKTSSLMSIGGMLDNLFTGQPKTLFNSQLIKFAFSKSAQQELRIDFTNENVSCLNSGFWILARAGDYNTIINSQPIYYRNLGILAPKGMSQTEATGNSNPLLRISYAIVRARIREVNLSAGNNERFDTNKAALRKEIQDEIERQLENKARLKSPLPRIMGKPIISESEETNEVCLGASTPGIIFPKQSFVARFVAYPEQFEKQAERKLKNLSSDSKVHLGIDYCNWEKNTKVKVKLHGNHLVVKPNSQEFVWVGKIKIINFDILVSDTAPIGENTHLKFDVTIDGFIVARLRITLSIDRTKSQRYKQVKIKPFKTAFASYARKDIERVMDRLSEIRRHVDVYFDCLSLHPGDKWKKKLKKEIKSRDILMLFWSKNAKESEWVEWEWRTAYKSKGGINRIDPHPLEDPMSAPPPDELKDLHFDDVYNIFRNSRR